MLRFRLAGLCALALVGTAAQAADFDGPYGPPRAEYGGYEHRPPPPPEPVFRRPRFTAGPEFGPPPERCRVFVKRRIDPYGEEVVRRVRVCDEPGGYDDGPRRRPVFFDGPPRPLRDIPYRRAWDGSRW